MIQSPALRRVSQGELCSGCGLCAGLSDGAFALEEQAPGFLRPPVDVCFPAETESLVAAACPGSRLPTWPEGADVSWGPITKCQTGHATDPEIRFRGSSGGVLTALAVTALETGLVDGIVHVAGDPDRPTRNVTVISHDRASVLVAAGSRYAPSSPLDRFGELLGSGERYLFIGKPCDVSALNALAERDDRVAQTFPYRLSFLCGGIPNFAGTGRFLTEMGLAGRKLASFRYRGNGWPGLTEARTTDGKVATMRYAASC